MLNVDGCDFSAITCQYVRISVCWYSRLCWIYRFDHSPCDPTITLKGSPASLYACVACGRHFDTKEHWRTHLDSQVCLSLFDWGSRYQSANLMTVSQVVCQSDQGNVRVIQFHLIWNASGCFLNPGKPRRKISPSAKMIIQTRLTQKQLFFFCFFKWTLFYYM